MKEAKPSTPSGWIKPISDWSLWAQYSRMEWFLIIVALLTIFFVILNFFTSFSERKDPPHTTVSLSYGDMDTFEKTISFAVNSPIVAGSPVTILENGSGQFLPDLLKEISSSKDYIYMTNYLWDGGTFGNTIFDALIKKAKDGVRVRVLLDGVGSHKADEDKIKELTSLGGQVAYFRPVRWWNVNRWDRRTHMRDVVIDGKIGYLGGIAFTDAWLGDATSTKTWHDYMFKVSGAPTHSLEGVFANAWSQTTGEILPTKSSVTEATGNGSHFIPLFSSPAPDTSSNMENFIWTSIEAAHTSIYIENPYILPSKAIKEALIKKAKAGVEVTIIGPGATDAYHVKWASESYYTELLDAGVKIYEYQKSLIHAKTMILDGKWVIIGSANLDNRSSKINLELIAGTDDRDFIKNLNVKFNSDISDAKEITKENWSVHSKLMLPLSTISRLFVKQY